MVSHEIIGDDMQAVIISMAQGDQVRAEAGGMMFMTEHIEMDAKMEGGILGGECRRARRIPDARPHEEVVAGGLKLGKLVAPTHVPHSVRRTGASTSGFQSASPPPPIHEMRGSRRNHIR